MSRQQQSKFKQREVKEIYTKCCITKSIELPCNVIAGDTLAQTIELTISRMIEGKCIVEGFVKKGSTRVLTYSSGIVKSDKIWFDVVFECLTCFPVAGMLLNCNVFSITKGGIQAKSIEEEPTPFIVYIARDHYYAKDYFNNIKVGDKIVARVIAQRFELNDTNVSVIAEIVQQPKETVPTIIFED
jgi:DNA-directed RNA polymerase subunit E'/Rpb7